MPTAYKVLGQSAPAATTLTTLYTVPAATQAVISTIVITNRASTDTTFRIAVRPGGAAAIDAHYIVFDSSIVANDIIALTLGITLAATDVLSVYSGNANLSFNAFGSEIS